MSPPARIRPSIHRLADDTADDLRRLSAELRTMLAYNETLGGEEMRALMRALDQTRIFETEFRHRLSELFDELELR